jgi:shikimate kinase
MSHLHEHMAPTSAAWCGRSWEGLVDRRDDLFQQALALRNATDANSMHVANEFLAFFDETGTGLFRDEEEWILRSQQTPPQAVLAAREGHIEISALIKALSREAQAGCVDLRVLHRLGDLLETHQLLEEEEVRPLLHKDRRVLLPRR